MPSANGEKSQIIKWLLGVLWTIIFAWACKVTASVWALETKSAVLETNYEHIVRKLDSIEVGVKTLLEGRRR